MEKRLILAIALSLLVLLTWSALVSRPKEIVAIKSPAKQIAPPATVQELPPSSLFKYTQEKFELAFIEPLAAIKEVTFKMHQD